MPKEKQHFVVKTIKRFLQPFYQKLAYKLKEDLQITEQQRLLHHLIGQIDKLSNQQLVLTDQIKATNLLVSGVYNNKEDDPSNLWSTSVISDIVAILKNQPPSFISVFNYFDKIVKTPLKNKRLIFISNGHSLYSQIAKKQGAKSIMRIEMNPLVADREKFYNQFDHEKVIYIYPANIGTLSYPLVDFLFIPRPTVGSFLIKHHLFNLGAQVKERAFISLTVKTNSVFSTVKKPPFWQEENRSFTIFNDHYVRRQLHQAGFFEVKCLYSQGIEIKNQHFDQKVTHLSYQDDYKVVKDNKIKDNKLFADSHISVKTYVASKLPEFNLKTS